MAPIVDRQSDQALDNLRPHRALADAQERPTAAEMKRPRIQRIPTEWSYVERFCPGAYQAWLRDVDLPTADGQFMIGVTGRPLYVVAVNQDARYCFRGTSWERTH